MTLTINQERYRNVIDRFHGLLQRRQDLRFECQWFQQDGATPHTATATMRHLDELFAVNVISKKSNVPPISDLLASFCGDSVKTTCSVYHNNPQNVIELQRSVEDFIKSIPRVMCERVIESFKHCVTECINRRGDYYDNHRI